MSNQTFPVGLSNRGMSERKVLHSWKEIATYMSVGVRTAQRYEALYGMPLHRPAGKDRSAVLALSDELDGWLNNTPERISTEAAAASVDATAQHQTCKPTYPSSRN